MEHKWNTVQKLTEPFRYPSTVWNGLLQLVGGLKEGPLRFIGAFQVTVR